MRELWAYLRIRKKWWLAPMLLTLMLLGLVLVTAQGTTVAPFVYSFF
ncbi:MAG: DUF5989 family protein [Myxococcota bacterium]